MYKYVWTIAFCLLLLAGSAAAASDIFEQCANDKSVTGECDWIGSILQGSNSAYTEGMSVNQRILLQDVATTGGNVHTLTFSHEATKGGIHAYDFLTAWNQGNTPPIIENACDTSTGMKVADAAVCNSLRTGGNSFAVSVPDDSFTSKDGSTQNRIDAFELAFGDRTITVYGDAAITDANLTLIHSVGDGGDTGDSDIEYILTWVSESENVFIEFAGHIAISGDSDMAWGPGLGASAISGGPYHVRMGQLDGASLGSDDNQIKGADIVIVPNSTLIVIKEVINDDGGTANASDFTINVNGTNPDPSTFPGDASGTLVNLESGDYVVWEDEVEGYTVSYSENCTGSLIPGEERTCTVTNDDIFVPMCGDGEINQESEACDDGNTDNDDGCNEFCQIEFCGDGTLQEGLGEACDDGNNDDGDGCTANCALEFCGDGAVNNNGTESCDDGNNDDGDGCTATCEIEFCGDGIQQEGLGEACDDGNNDNDDGCNDVCELEFCGDGVQQSNEACDDGNNDDGDGCNDVCEVEFCGDGIQQEGLGEACDDGNNDDGDGCDSVCQVEFCGDGITQEGLGEACDDGNNDDEDGCDAQCQVEFCGDGITQEPLGEQCDDGNTDNEDGCSEVCIIEFCGDSVVQEPLGEQCDDGNNNDDDGCSAQCLVEACGDGIQQESEQCDDGNNDNDDGCSEFCQVEFCGDGVQQASEACDDGNNIDGDGCTAACEIEFCGDGVVNNDGTEACDDGNNDDGDGCTATCEIEFCGDGIQQEGLGEACDDGNNDDNDGCDAQCQIEFCGDGVQQSNEACDDGNNDNDDGCNDVCELEFCGDGVQQSNEACDDGNNDNDDGCNDVCELEFCGDGVQQSNEACDDGNNDNEDGCNETCELEFCGDGIVQQGLGEECDGEAPEGFICTDTCKLEAELSCEEALDMGLLYGEIVDGTAIVYNDANTSFEVSLAVYEMYAALIEDQELYDADTQVVSAMSSSEFDVELPACRYQIDLVCGQPLEPPFYTEEQKLDFHFGNEDLPYCVPDPEDSDYNVDLTIDESHQACREYVFNCEAEGFEPTHYYWYFGDGEILPNTTLSSVFHTYEENGNYVVACTATNGTVSQSDTLEISPECYTCEEAVDAGLLTATIEGEHATVYNDAEHDYFVSFASYEMYADLIEDQLLYDSHSGVVAAGNQLDLWIEVPACTHQVDVVCGAPLGASPYYGNKMIESAFSLDDDFCTPRERDGDSNVDVSVADHYPQNGAYVFICDVEGFEPTGYYWYFGDGDIQPNSPNANVYHQYDENGDYTVACTATDGETWQTGTLDIQVTDAPTSADVEVMEGYPQGSDYVFVCTTQGFEPTSYDWNFGDGNVQYDLLVSDVFHTFESDGEYQVTCSATDGETTEDGWINVVVAGECTEYTLEITDASPNPVSPSGDVTVTGTLHETASPEADLSGMSVFVNGEEASVLLNEWMVVLEAPESGSLNIEASIDNSCEETFSDSTSVDVEELIVLSTQTSSESNTVKSNGGSASGDCYWDGWHKEGDTCVRNEEPVQEPVDNGADAEIVEETVEEEPIEETSDDESDLITGAVVGGGFGAIAWLWLLLLVIGLLFAGYLYSRK